ncbi:phage tail protein [Boudabousia marimammalium]|uniref:Bacteriophage tail tape measure N-terminal domain-containing protein n=1 Tax=Boudabousia marimammalium TaxID=156892 RepID=A0A1Q5PNZ1_9ACTO|nr:hypothetical protein [Boudabousia marimammalium]OKL49294.1 hypothetical protein BM477_04745 [Boudabousia marimammalium]
MAGQKVIVSVLAETKQFKRAMGNLGKQSGLSGLAARGKKAAHQLKIGATVVAAAVAGTTAALIHAGEEAGTSNTRIKNITESMNLFAGRTDAVANRLVKYADAQARAYGVDQNVIKQTQAKLLTFGELAKTADKVGGNFDRATQAAIDLAAAGFGTAEANAVQLGKALNDPVKGLASLSKSGVTFTEQEKQRIATLVESNKMGEAQSLVLAAIEKQVGGTAKATANWTDRIKVMGSQMVEYFGLKTMPLLDYLGPKFEELIPKVQAFIDNAILRLQPAWESFSTWMTSTGLPALQAAGAWIKTNLSPVVKELADFLQGTLLPALKDFGTFIATSVVPTVADFTKLLIDNRETIKKLAIPVIAIVAAWKAYKTALAAVAVAQAGYALIMGKASTLMTIWNGVTKAAAIAQHLLNVALTANPIGLVIAAIAALVAGFVLLYNNSETVRNGVQAAWAGMKAAAEVVVNFYQTYVAPVLSKVWAGIKTVVSTYINVVLVVIRTVLNMIKAVWNGDWAQVGRILTAAWNAFKYAAASGLQGIVGVVRQLPSKIMSGIGNIGNLLYGVGKSVIQGFINGIKNMFGYVRSTLGKLTDMLPSWKGPADKDKRLLTPAGEMIMKSLVAGFTKTSPQVKQALNRLTQDIADYSGPMLKAQLQLEPTALHRNAHSRLNSPKNVTYNITVTTWRADAQTGQEIVRAIKAYEKVGGR